MSGEAAAAADPVEGESYLGMSDEDIMGMTGPGAAAVVAPEVVVDPAAAAVETPAIAAEPEAPVVVADPKADPAAVVDPAAKPAAADPAGSAEAKPAGEADPADPTLVPAEAAAAEADAAVADYEGFYKQIMTPFKANGKTIQLKDPAEAVQLMQMGANYTRKMQELVPHRKSLTMLQNNNIDEGKLSFLIDLDKKNPEAIKKLIKESGIDPLEIDTSSEPAYLEGNHQVTDEEVNFRSALDDLGSTPDGKATLQVINSTWDQASKDVLWKSPENMALIHDQREYGIYDRIVAEVDRQKTLGSLPAGTPFLQAYKVVGDQLTAAGAFTDLIEKRSGTAPTEALAPPGPVASKAAPEAVATRVVPPKSPVANAGAASAASATRATPATAQEFVNPLSLSDDDFLKQFNGRL
jgi:hypothetical protein